MIAPQIADKEAPANYYRAFKDVAAQAPEGAIICSEGASTMDNGRTQLPNLSACHTLYLVGIDKMWCFRPCAS